MLLMLPVAIGVSLAFRSIARVATRHGSRAMAAVNDNIQESVTGISVAKNFRQEAMIYDEFGDVNRQSYRINLRRGAVFALVFPVLNGVVGFAIATVLYVGATIVNSGAIELGAWFLFVQSVDRFWFPFINIAALWGQIQQGMTATERIFALIDAENEVIQTDPQPAGTLRGEIVFDHVRFQYKTGDPVLDDFNLTISPGESVAFVGHTGAGKSTIAKLIARFYEFQGGEIRIDGRDIRTFDLHSYRVATRHRAAAALPVQRHGDGEHPLQQPRPERRRDRARSPTASAAASGWRRCRKACRPTWASAAGI